nr:transporter substrate-binding domain-containing protein [Anaerolineae bacterium]
MNLSGLNKFSLAASLKGGLAIAAFLLIGLSACDATEDIETVTLPTATEIVNPNPTPTRTPSLQVLPAHSLAVPDWTGSSVETIRESRILRVGVLFNATPLSYMLPSGQVGGYEVALLAAIAGGWDVELQYMHVTRQTRLESLLIGEVDILVGAVSQRRDQARYVEYTEPVFMSGFALLVKDDVGDNLAALLDGATIAVVEPGNSMACEELVAQHAANARCEPVLSIDQALVDLMSGEVGAVIARYETAIPVLARYSAVRLIDVLDPEYYAFAVKRGDAWLRDLVNQGLFTLISSGEAASLYSAELYGNTPELFARRTGTAQYSLENFPTGALADPTVIQRLLSGEPLRVGGLAQVDSYSEFDSRAIYDGFNRAVINELARRWNVPVVEYSGSDEPASSLLISGEVDLVTGIQPELSQYGTIAFSQAYYTEGVRLIHLQDVPVAGIADLERRAIYVVDPVAVSTDLVNLNNRFPVVLSADSLVDAFLALRTRGVVAVVGNEYILSLMGRADDRIVFDDARYRVQERVFATPINDPDFLRLINLTLQDMQQDGTLLVLREQYFEPYLPPGATYDDLPSVIWAGPGEQYLGLGGY